MSKTNWSSILCVAAMILCLGAMTFGQEITGSINGTVRDSSGAIVPGATVTITDPAKNDLVVRTLTTNEDGEYSAPNLAISTYNITVEAPNFKKSVSTDVKLDVGQRRTVDIALAAGRIDETVTVEADRVAVDLTTATSGTVINGDQVRELSINNRNFVQLVALAPGVSNDLADQVYVGTTNPDGQANTINIAVNGARSSQNTFTVDGADITDRGSNITIQAYPSVDAIGEFKVLRSLYPAESGNSGGGQVNVITRSGTSEFHGTLFEFVRNEKLNANDFLTNLNTALPRGDNGKVLRRPFRYNNYGGTIGGPVYFFNFGENDGGMFRRWDKTFFFFSEEIRKDIRYPTLSSTVPDANMRQGVFPIDICLSANAPTTATATCLNVLPAGTPLPTINPVARQYLNYIYNNLPLPTNPVTRELSYPTLGTFDFQQEIIKIDHSFTNNWSAYYRYQRDTIPTLEANSLFSSGSGLPGVSTTETDSPGRAHTFQTNYVASPSLIFEGRYTYSYGAILSNNVGTLARVNSPISVPLPYEVTRDRVPTISGNGFSALQGFGYYDNFSDKNSISGAVTKIAGSHTFKFGGAFSKYRKNENAIAGNNEGIFSGFLNVLTTSPQQVSVLAPNAATQEPSTTRRANFQAFANFLLGNNASFTQARFDYTGDLRQRNVEAFAQDEWKVRPNLTLYAGVRYSFFGAPWDRNGRLTNFDPELFQSSLAPLVTGGGARVLDPTKNFCNGLIINTQNTATAPNCTPIMSPHGKFVVEAPKTDFAPRVGLAWDPFGKGETSVRTGYGIYHEQVLNGVMLQVIGLNPPFQQTCSVSRISLSNPVPSGDCTPVASTTAPNVRGIQRDWKTPYMQHWSLDVQHQLTPKTVATVGYYGSKGTNLIGAFELNDIPPGYAISRGPTGCAVGTSTTPTAPCQVAGTGFFSSAASTILDQLRPYRGYRSITMIQPRFDSNYHSMQVSAQHRFTGASQVNLAYTWSKNLTNNQTDRSTAPQNSFDIDAEWGRATLDRRHVFSLNYIYELPWYADQRGFAGKLLGGWQASGIVTYNTGLPFTATTSAFDPSGIGFIPVLIAGGRPNQICNPNEGGNRTREQWFNTACFTTNPLSTATNIENLPGNAGRGTIHGPRTFRVDFSMMKNIRFTETMRLQLRGEAFNIFNTTNFRAISTNVTAANYGFVTSVRDPRVIQLGIKFYF